MTDYEITIAFLQKMNLLYSQFTFYNGDIEVTVWDESESFELLSFIFNKNLKCIYRNFNT